LSSDTRPLHLSRSVAESNLRLVETRRVSEAAVEGRTVSGYAAVFDAPSQPIPSSRGAFVERIKPGAFSRSLRENRVWAYYGHDDSWPLGRTPDSLTLRQDAKGLAFELRLPDTTYGNDVATLMADGVLDGSMSFGFRSREDEWDRRDGVLHRTLLDVDLVEVSIVQEPAYPQTSAALRGHAVLPWFRRRLELAKRSVQ